eukprot:SAG11_NODE_7496_length_1137_cov_1.123314_1_plen_200_part_10
MWPQTNRAQLPQDDYGGGSGGSVQVPRFTITTDASSVEVLDEANYKWGAFCDEIMSIKHVKRQTLLTGGGGIWARYAATGLVTAAGLLWQRQNNISSEYYARQLIDALIQNIHSFSEDRLLESLDILRMMLYCVPCYKGEPPKLHPAFLRKRESDAISKPEILKQPPEIQAFVEMVEVNASDKDVAAAQTILCKCECVQW